MKKSFDERVWEKLKKIPRGKVATYKQIAVAINNPLSSRAVGNACNRNPFSPKVPCHRVVKFSGEIGGYAGGTKKKIFLLKKEGIKINNNKILNFEEVLINRSELR